jgi:hypothetical protein
MSETNPEANGNDIDLKQITTITYLINGVSKIEIIHPTKPQYVNYPYK